MMACLCANDTAISPPAAPAQAIENLGKNGLCQRHRDLATGCARRLAATKVAP